MVEVHVLGKSSMGSRTACRYIYSNSKYLAGRQLSRCSTCHASIRVLGQDFAAPTPDTHVNAGWHSGLYLYSQFSGGRQRLVILGASWPVRELWDQVGDPASISEVSSSSPSHLRSTFGLHMRPHRGRQEPLGGSVVRN